MLDEDADEPLQAPQRRPVDHHRLVAGVVGADVLAVEALGTREVVVELDGAELPLAAEGVVDDEVDLRAVESGFAELRLTSGEIHAAGDAFDRPLRLGPALGRADIFVALRISEAEPHREVREGQAIEDFEREVDAALDLPLDLLRHAEDVGVVLREPADTRQAAEFTRLLVAVDGAELRQSQRQLLVAPRPRLVDHRVVRAVHGFEEILLVLLHHDRLKLAVGVVGIVAGDLVEIDLADVGRVDGLIAPRRELFAHEGLERAPQERAFGHPEDQPRADQRARRKQIELLAEDAVVALPRFLERRQVRVEIFLRKPGGAVEPLELGVVGVPLPVGAGDARELKSADAAGAGDVRPATEIDKLPLAIERQRGKLGEARLDVLCLEGLVEAGDDLHRLLPRHLDPLEGLVGGDDLPHLLFDPGEIVVGDRLGRPHVVVEPGPDRRPEGKLDAWKQPHHGPGHDVGRRVAHHRQGARIARKKPLDERLAMLRKGSVEPDGLSIEEGGNRRQLLLPATGHADGDIRQSGALGKLAGIAIREADGGHGGGRGWEGGKRWEGVTRKPGDKRP